jgi:hypothetical protein
MMAPDRSCLMVRRFRHPVNEADRAEARRAAEHWTKVKAVRAPAPSSLPCFMGRSRCSTKASVAAKLSQTKKNGGIDEYRSSSAVLPALAFGLLSVAERP